MVYRAGMYGYTVVAGVLAFFHHQGAILYDVRSTWYSCR